MGHCVAFLDKCDDFFDALSLAMSARWGELRIGAAPQFSLAQFGKVRKCESFLGETRVEDKPHLESLTSQIKVVKDRVRGVVHRKHTGLYLFGRQGTGKTNKSVNGLRRSKE